MLLDAGCTYAQHCSTSKTNISQQPLTLTANSWAWHLQQTHGHANPGGMPQEMLRPYLLEHLWNICSSLPSKPTVGLGHTNGNRQSISRVGSAKEGTQGPVPQQSGSSCHQTIYMSFKVHWVEFFSQIRSLFPDIRYFSTNYLAFSWLENNNFTMLTQYVQCTLIWEVEICLTDKITFYVHWSPTCIKIELIHCC